MTGLSPPLLKQPIPVFFSHLFSEEAYVPSSKLHPARANKASLLKPAKHISFSPPVKNTSPKSLRKLNQITHLLQQAWGFSSLKGKTHTWIHLGWKPRSNVQYVAYTTQNTIPRQNARAQQLTLLWVPVQGQSHSHTRKRWFLSSYQERVQ